MRVDSVYRYVEGKIGGVFASYGRFVARHAWKIVIVAVLLNGLFGIGMIKLTSENKAENVYMPIGTQARVDRERAHNTFPDRSGYNYNSLALTTSGAWARVLIRSTSGNLLNRESLLDIEALDTFIQNLTFVPEAGGDEANVIRFSDVCARSDGACSVDGDMFWSPDFLASVDVEQVTYPLFTYSAGTTNYASDLGGQVETNGSYLTKMEFVSLDYIIRTDGPQYTVRAAKWFDVFKDRLSTYASDKFDIAFAHSNSMDEELAGNIRGDVKFFSITMTLMITYACVATLSARMTDQVGQRMWLGFAGVFAAGFAIVSGFGLVAASGVDFVSIVGVVPFLVIEYMYYWKTVQLMINLLRCTEWFGPYIVPMPLTAIFGIGIDDMFILLSGLSGAAGKTTVEDKMAETMRASGVGITITTLTDFIAFMAGAGSSFVAVKNFCIYTGVAVLLCYLNNVTFFAATMAINERRVSDNRHYMTCRRIKTKEELEEEGASKRTIMCCGGRPPQTRQESESYMDKLPRWIIPKIVLDTPCKIFICLLFACYLAAAIFGCINLKQGLQFTQLVNEDSYYYKYASWKEDYFKRQTPVSFVTDASYTYSDPRTQSMIDDLVTKAQADSFFENTFEVNWLKSYKSSNFFDDSSEANLIAGFKQFTANPQNALFENDVVFDASNTSIIASRIYVISNDMPDSQEEGKMMLRSREIASESQFKCYAFSPYFVAYEQYVAILGQTLQTVGIALVAVFVVTCIFMPHPALIIYVTVAVAMIMTGVFGYLLYLDVALSSITMIHLIMSIGFSVDFTAHICHGYMISEGNTREIRVRQAIEKTGSPIFHGAISSILGIIMLVFAKSYIFRTFATVMAFVLIFGIAHALLLLPVVLSWIGPNRLNEVAEDPGSSHYTSDRKSGQINGGFHANGNDSKPVQMIGLKQL